MHPLILLCHEHVHWIMRTSNTSVTRIELILDRYYMVITNPVCLYWCFYCQLQFVGCDRHQYPILHIYHRGVHGEVGGAIIKWSTNHAAELTFHVNMALTMTSRLTSSEKLAINVTLLSSVSSSNTWRSSMALTLNFFFSCWIQMAGHIIAVCKYWWWWSPLTSKCLAVSIVRTSRQQMVSVIWHSNTACWLL